MNSKVTVYITNYNYGQYLEQAIQSVLDQTFQGFELLIIDDGSTDDSMNVIKQFELIDNVFVILQKNKGLTVSNNIALRMARGEYFMRLDADDYLDPHCLEMMVSVMDKQFDLALVFPDYYEVDINGEILNQVRRHDFTKDVTLLDQPAHGACTLIRTNILREVGGYDESIEKQDGYDLWLRLIEGHRVSNINLPLFYYRQHSNSLSSNEKDLLETRAQIIKKRINKTGSNSISVLAVIPTRGSKMDPRSMPLRTLDGKPLIDWTIDSALDSNLLTDIIITTPDEEVIHHVSEKYGSKVIALKRSEEIARINAGFDETILESLEKYEETYHIPNLVMVLNTESPFKSTMYIDKAIHTLQLYEVDVVQSVIIDDGYFFEHDGNGLRPRIKNSALRLERNNLYRESGGIRIYQRDALLDGDLNKLIIGHVIVDEKSAMKLKTQFHWDLAEKMLP